MTEPAVTETETLDYAAIGAAMRPDAPEAPAAEEPVEPVETETTEEAAAEEAPPPVAAEPAEGKKRKLSDLQREVKELGEVPEAEWTPERAQRLHRLSRQVIARSNAAVAWAEKERAKTTEQRELLHRELTQREEMMADVRALESPDVDVRLNALSRLTRRPAAEVVEDMVLRQARQQKPDPRDEEIAKLKARQDERDKAEGFSREVQTFASAIRDSAQWPHIAEAAAGQEADAVKELAAALKEEQSAGHAVDAVAILTRYELAIARARKSQVAPVAAPEAAPAAPPAPRAKPGPRPSVGRSIDPSIAEQASESTRELTEQERHAMIGKMLRG